MEVKVRQAQYLMVRLADFVADQRKKQGVTRMPWLLGGDFNSQPFDPVYNLLLHGQSSIPSSTAPDKTETLVHPLAVESAYRTHRRADGTIGEPYFTNYTLNFKGCLDYLFYDKENIIVSEVLELPSEEALKAETALPSSAFASDHLPLSALVSLPSAYDSLIWAYYVGFYALVEYMGPEASERRKIEDREIEQRKASTDVDWLIDRWRQPNWFLQHDAVCW